MSGLTPAELVVVALFLVLIVVGVVALLRHPPHRAALQIGGADQASQAEWDRRLASVPQHADLRLISERLHTVERVCDVMRAELGGVKDAMTRVERMANMLLERQLEEGKS